MNRLSPLLLAQIGAAVLLLVVIRSLGEVFRLEYVSGDALTLAEARPFVVGALAAALALAVALAAMLAERQRLSLAVTASTIVLLLLYKVFWIG